MNWTKEQLEAITECGKNIIVSAGAGSGKTEVLSERVIYNLKNRNMHINEMLILTFTKNAAYEMKERIKKKILKNEEIINEAKLIDSADITNFDAYTLALVKKYHYILNLDANLGIIDSSIINVKKNKIINEIFDEYYKENNTSFNTMILNFCNKNDKPIKELILNLDTKLELLTNKEEYLNNYIANYYNETNMNNLFEEYTNILKELINKIKLLLDNLYYETPSKFYEKYFQTLTPLINAQNYEEIKNNLDIENIRLTGATNQAKKYKSQITDIIKELKKQTIYTKEEQINNIYKTKDTAIIIINILKTITTKINNYKQEHNLYEFNDISKFAIKLLKENNEIREEIKNNFKEIMIDEYQDTSDIEEEFINLIENQNVYMVGDIKQSIYRFRNANPNIFKDKYDLYKKEPTKGKKIDLNKNFRSREEVLSNINKIFDPIMDNKIGNAEYKKEHNLIFGNNSFNIEGKTNNNNNIQIINYTKTKENTQEEIEAYIIAQDIKNKIEKKYQVFDKKTRNCKYSDFCILMDRGTTFQTYKRIFDYLKIPLHIYQDEDILFSTETYLINNIITLLINIKKNIYNTETNFAYTSIARSYLFNIKDEEIYQTIKNKKIKETEIYNTLLPIAKEIENLSNKEILKQIIDKLNIYEKLPKVGDIKEKTIILNNLLNKVEELNKVGIDIYGINEYIKSLIENKESIKIPASHIDIDAVTLTNIHKSKGLEYKICYYSGLYKDFSNQDIKPKIRYDEKYGIIIPIYQNGYINTFTSILNQEQYKNNDISEKIRLFYVALTRCKEKMIMIGSFQEKEDYIFDNQMVDYITRSTYKNYEEIINSIYPYIKEYITNIDTPTISKEYKINKKLNIKSNTTEKITVTEIKNIENQIEEEHYSKTNTKLHTKEEIKNMEKGTKIHYILEITDFKNPNYNNLTNEEINIIKNLLKQNIMNNIKNAKIYKEYEFIYEENNTIKRGIIDLMLEYNTHIDIIDYKLKNTIDESYKTQLKGYKEYIEKLTKKPVYTYLYSLIDTKLTQIN